MTKNLLLLCVSTMVSLVFLELAIRVAMPERLAFVPTLLNNELTYVPDQHERSRHLEWDHEVRINADGFRNDKTLAEISAEATLALGDSFTEGYGVALDDSYPKRLEQLLQTERPGAHVYNAGHYDTALPTYRRVYQMVFKDIPEIRNVIIGFCMSNDILRTANPPDGRLQSGNEFGDSWKYKLKVFLGSHLATYAAMNYTIKTNPTLFDLCKSLGACYRPRPPNIYTAEVIEDAIPHTLNFTAKLAEEIRADHRNVVVLLIPTREQVDDELWAKAALEYGTDANEHRFTLNSRLAAGLKAAGVDVLDLTPIAVAHQRATGEQLYFKYDGHWNPAGQALAAKHLADFIRSKWRP